MKASHAIGAVVDTVIKIVVIIVVVMFTYKYATQAYDFGYRIFAEQPVTTAENATIISISITEDATAMDIGKVLEEKGLINDARLFYVQEMLSGHHDEMRPGIYELNSAMTSKEMIEVLTAEPSEEEAEAESGTEVETATENGAAEESGTEADAENAGEAAGAE